MEEEYKLFEQLDNKNIYKYNKPSLYRELKQLLKIYKVC